MVHSHVHKIAFYDEQNPTNQHPFRKENVLKTQSILNQKHQQVQISEKKHFFFWDKVSSCDIFNHGGCVGVVCVCVCALLVVSLFFFSCVLCSLLCFFVFVVCSVAVLLLFYLLF